MDHYFHLLVELKYFRQVSEHLFMKIKSISIPKQIDEAMRLDAELQLQSSSPAPAMKKECFFFGMQDL